MILYNPYPQSDCPVNPTSIFFYDIMARQGYVRVGAIEFDDLFVKKEVMDTLYLVEVPHLVLTTIS